MNASKDVPYVGAIVQKNAGHIVPERFIEKLLEHNTSCFGVALATGGVLDVRRSMTAMPIANIMKTQEATKDDLLTMFFGNFPQGFHADNLQPFTILDDAGKEILVAFLAGDFDSFAQTKSSHSDTFFAVKTDLIPRIHRLYDILGRDLGKLITEMRTAMFKKDMLRTWTENGTIIFVSATGDIVPFSKNELESTYEWGVTSNAYGYKEIEHPDTSPAATAAASKLAALGGTPALPSLPAKAPTIGDIADKASPATATALPAKVGEIATQLLSKAPPEDETVEWETRSPPEGLTNKNLRAWYNQMVSLGATFPKENWKDKPAVKVRKTKPIKSFQEIPKPPAAATSTLPTLPATNPSLPAKAPDAHFPTIDQSKGGEPTKVADVAGMGNLPILSAEEKNKVDAMFSKRENVIKFKDIEGKPMIDPATIPDVDKQKVPSFFEQTGISLGTVLHLQYEDFAALVTNHPEAAKILLKDLTLVCFKLIAGSPPAQQTKPAAASNVGSLPGLPSKVA